MKAHGWRLLVGVAALAALVLGAGVVLIGQLNWPPVSIEKLRSLRQGASRSEVRAVLGEPTNTYETNRIWAYSRPHGWSIVYIHFDEQGRFERAVYDY